MNLNLLQQVIETPKIKRYANPRITRSGLSSNPVERYSFTGGTVFANDVLAKHGSSFFIGGDVATYEFDMGLKVAGSVSECPVKMYARANATLYVPSDFPSYELNTQSDIDKVKTNDAVPLSKSNNGSGNIIQLMLELDLTPLCNSLFGGSNSALKAALKSINVDVWAQGSGASSGALTNGCRTSMWSGAWGAVTGTSQALSTSSNITQMNFKRTLPDVVEPFVSSSNKLYILIASQYASDGTIASTVQLDYFNIKIDIARTPDTVSPIQVNLPKYWAMVVKGFSPSWDNPSNTKMLFDLKNNADNGYKCDLNSSLMYFTQRISGANSAEKNFTTSSFTDLKGKVSNIIFQCTPGGLSVIVLKNNGTIFKTVPVTVNNYLSGLFYLHVLQAKLNTTQADAFAESFHLVDLARIGKVRFGNELVQNGDFSQSGTGWTVNAGTWTFENGTANLTGSAGWQYLYQDIAVTPNTTYIFTAGLTQTNTVLNADEFNSSGATVKVGVVDLSPTTTIKVLTVSSTTTKVRIFLQARVAGTFTFDNISLKQVIQDGFTDAEAEGILRGMVKGKNLINKAKLVLGDMNSANGADMASSTWLRHNEYIKCSPNTDYIRTSPSSSFVTWYDINKNYIGLYSNNPRVTSPVNAEYMRWSFAGTDTNAQIMVEQSSTATAYEPYMENPLGITNPELFDINKVTLNQDASIQNNVIVLNATANQKNSYINIPVLPNNLYEIKYTATGNTRPQIDYFYNNINIASDVKAVYVQDTTWKYSFLTTTNTNKIRLYLGNGNSGAGTFTFSDISLKLKM